MHFIWNGLLSKAVVLQEAHGSKDLRFFGISIGWLGFGFVVGVDRQPTKHALDGVPPQEAGDLTPADVHEKMWRLRQSRRK